VRSFLNAVMAVALLVAGITGVGSTTPAQAATLGWTAAPQPLDTYHAQPQDVSCASATLCVAVDRFGAGFVFNGTTWSAGKRVLPELTTGDVASVSCAPGTTFCVAVGGHHAARYSAGVWQAADVVSSEFALTTIACVATNFCMTADYAEMSYKWDGSAWLEFDNAGTTFDPRIACGTKTFCMLADVSKSAIRYDGAGWLTDTPMQLDTPPVKANDVPSVSATFCAAFGATGSMYLGVSGTWTAYPGGAASLVSGSCRSVTFCVAIDSLGSVRTFNGTTWASANIAGGKPLAAVSCALATAFCLAVAPDGRAFKYAAGAWSAAGTFDLPATSITSLACATAAFCLAVKQAGTSFVKRRAVWSAAAKMRSAAIVPTSVACASATYCVAAGAKGASIYNGTSWTAAAAHRLGRIVDLACPSATLCVAAGAYSVAQLKSSKWQAPTKISTTGRLKALSCPSASLCLAVGATSGVGTVSYKWASGRWSSAVMDKTKVHTLLRCASTTLCVAISAKTYRVWKGRWAASKAIAGLTLDVRHLSCLSAFRCVALTADSGAGKMTKGSQAITFVSTAFQAPVVISPDISSTALSCPRGSTVCLATDALGRVRQGQVA